MELLLERVCRRANGGWLGPRHWPEERGMFVQTRLVAFVFWVIFKTIRYNRVGHIHILGVPLPTTPFPTLPQQPIGPEQKMIREHALTKNIKDELSFFIENKTTGKNPYRDTDAAEIAGEIAKHLMQLLEKENAPSSSKLHQAISDANRLEANVGPLIIRNCFVEPAKDLVPPREPRGFDYGTNPSDRMKQGFVSEWTSWAMAIAFNLENATHPAEHGGNNRFHMISPISEANHSLRLTGASTGGGRFHLHNDASVYTAPTSKEMLIEKLRCFGITLKDVSSALGKSEHTLFSEISCGKFMRVDFTMLSGIVNLDTETYIGTPQMLYKHLIDSGYSNADIRLLSKMPVAHFAGPADDDISGYVGNISPPLFLDGNGEIDSVCLNLAESRMQYVGTNPTHKSLFDRFVADSRNAPHHKVTIAAGDILLFPNSPFASQKNVMHGRGKLKDSDYKIEVSPGKFMRRVHCRQYLTSRIRDEKPSFLASV